MSFDHTDPTYKITKHGDGTQTAERSDKPDWLIVWFPQIFLAGCVLPIVAFAVLAVIL